MHRSILRAIPSTAVRSVSRPLSTTAIARASKPAHEPASTQGHTVDKAHTTLHKDADIQSAATRAGQDAKDKAETKTSGEDEPFDAARQGQPGGESKGHGATGSFRDQVGGQDEPQKGAGAVKGDAETAAGYNVTETVANKVKDGFNFLKQMRSDGRNFSTSTRMFNGNTPRADPEGARKPVDTSVQGDQNAHLKHASGGSQGHSGKGNASPNPSLPSKDKQVNTAQSKGARSFSTSTRALADPNTPSGNAPLSGQKDAQSQTGVKQQPRAGDSVEHGGATGAPSSGSKGVPEGNAHPASGTAAPDPGLSKGEQQTAKKANQTRSFSTSTRVLADPNTPSTDAPIHGQKVAQSQTGLKQQPRAGDNVEHGGATGTPSQGSAGAPESAPNPASGTGAPDPGLSKKEKEGANRDGMGIRSFSTSTRIHSKASQAKAIPSEAAKAGYDAPPTALPSNLKSAYQEVDPNAIQQPDADLKASSEIPHSSSARDPPNQALRKAVLEGNMPEMNPQPDVPGTETGRQGIDEAWKHRK